MTPSRRNVILGAGLASAGIALAYGGVSLRLHARPRRYPDLSDTHLNDLRTALPQAAPPRILLVGNSASIHAGFLEHLSAAARTAEHPTTLARASANGARLIETLRISTFRQLLQEVDWNVVILQDFSATPFEYGDRKASIFAIRTMAKLAEPASVVLYPHWPSAPQHPVYRDGLGVRRSSPENIADYAARSQAHYERAARTCDGLVAPVLQDWLAALNAGATLYDNDLHHANEAGAKLAAQAVWRTVATALDQKG